MATKKTKARKVQTTQDLQPMAEHLLYEVRMLTFTGEKLSAGVADQQVKNALIEAMTMHARSLVHFTHPMPPIKESDVLAEDYFDAPADWEAVRPPLTTALLNVRRRVGKEIVHLTYDRANVTPADKVWDQVAIPAALRELLRVFAKHATKLDPKTNEVLKRKTPALNGPTP